MTTVTFDSTNLSDFGNITLLDDYLDLPARRGSDQMIPFSDGERRVNKFYEPKTILVGIAVIESNLAGIEGTLDDLRALLSPMTPKTLSFTLEDTTVRTALARVDKQLQVRRVSDTLARVVIEFNLTEPFFRSDTLIADNTTTIDSDPKAMTVTNTGTRQERNPLITLTGPLADFGMTNSENGLELNYAPVVDPGDTVIIQIINKEFNATHSVLGDVTGYLTHAGDSCLMAFEPGDNILSITSSTATTGTVKVSFYPPYL
jgi:hypothetical protein